MEGTGNKDRNEACSKALFDAFTEILERSQYSLRHNMMGPAPGPPINIFSMMCSDEDHALVFSGHASKNKCLVEQDDR